MDQEAFRKLVLTELDAVHRLAFHLCLTTHEADDLVQETYLRAFKSGATFQLTERGPRPWLFKILHNVFRTRLNKKSHEPVSAEDLEERIASPPIPPRSDLDWEQVDERLKKAVQALSPTYRGALLLWAVEGLKYREIAEVTGVAIGTVMSRLFRARQILAQQIAEVAIERRMNVGGPIAGDAPPGEADGGDENTAAAPAEEG